jgi:acyl-CoA synthetase (AMP-forming)/AMP-acid ligase II
LTLHRDAAVPALGDNPDTLPAALPARIGDVVRRWALATPAAPALHDGARHWSYAQLDAAVDEAVQVLRALAVRPGDRVMLVAENGVAQVALTFACARIDAWFVLVNGRMAAREIEAIRLHCGARRVLYAGPGPAGPADGAMGAGADAARPGHSAVASTHLGALLAGPLDAHCVAEPVVESGAGQVAALLYTTGTTGQPKGVMLSHRSLLFVAAVSGALRGLTPADRAYGVLPISHVYGLTSVMLGTLSAGACLYLAPRFAPDALLRALDEHQLTILQGVPAMYARLLETLAGADGAAPAQLENRLRFAYAGGSPLDAQLKRRVEALLGVPLHNGYGMTESAPTISQTRLDAPRDDGSVGTVIPGVEARIVDAAGRALPEGVPGELLVRGPNVMLGYYREPALSDAAIGADGWLRTGDLARRELDGALFIVGRKKELIIRSGFNVYPLEIETLLNAHPAVVQSAVVGRGAGDGNEEVIAFVETGARGADVAPTLQAALHDYLAPLLAPYKRPARFVAMAALPAAATGKVLRAELRKLAAALPDG